MLYWNSFRIMNFFVFVFVALNVTRWDFRTLQNVWYLQFMFMHDIMDNLPSERGATTVNEHWNINLFFACIYFNFHLLYQVVIWLLTLSNRTKWCIKMKTMRGGITHSMVPVLLRYLNWNSFSKHLNIVFKNVLITRWMRYKLSRDFKNKVTIQIDI